MSICRPGVLRVGDEIRLDGQLQAVVALSGESVRLVDATGATTVVLLPRLLSDPGFALVGAARVPLPPLGVLEGLPGEVVERARWWERQLVEVLTGLLPEPPAGTAPRPEYDPDRQSLRQRELVKVAELAAGGQAVGLSTLQRLRRAYEREGLWGLIDHRMARGASPTGRVDGAAGCTPAPGQVAARR